MRVLAPLGLVTLAKAPSGAQMLVSGAFRRQKPAFTTLTARKLENLNLIAGKIQFNSWKVREKMRVSLAPFNSPTKTYH